MFQYPRACPDSVLKFLTDIFSSQDTSGFFYTSDMMILIEIVLRQLVDLSPGAGVSFNHRPVSSVGRAPDCCAGGRRFKPRPDQHSGSLNN